MRDGLRVRESKLSMPDTHTKYEVNISKSLTFSSSLIICQRKCEMEQYN
jgi:hypothetical protein